MFLKNIYFKFLVLSGFVFLPGFACMKKQKVKALPEVVSFREHILPLFSASCVSSGCHSGNAPAAGLSLLSDVAYAELFKERSVDTVNFSASILYKEVASGAMPKGGKRMSDYDLGLIRRWIEQKAKNN